MRGANKARPVVRGDGKSLQVREIFYTIQGEGPFAGSPAVFVRLTGCNLRCHFCDTTWDDEKDLVRTVSYVLEQVDYASDYGERTSLVVLTGGEPARQPLGPLIDGLLARGMKVQLETAGTLWQECFAEKGVTIVCAPKLAKVHPDILNHCKYWKYVISAREVQNVYGLPGACTQVHGKGGAPFNPLRTDVICLMPMDEFDEEQNARNRRLVATLALKHGYHAGLQLHKFFAVP